MQNYWRNYFFWCRVINIRNSIANHYINTNDYFWFINHIGNTNANYHIINGYYQYSFFYVNNFWFNRNNIGCHAICVIIWRPRNSKMGVCHGCL